MCWVVHTRMCKANAVIRKLWQCKSEKIKVAIKIDTFCHDSIGKYEIFTGAHMLCSRLLWWQNFVWWCLIFVYPQCLTGISSPFWNLEFWGSCHIAAKFMHPWVYILLLCFIRTLFLYRICCWKNRRVLMVNPFQSNFSASRILSSSYLFWAGKRLVDYL
jgi:hypothetical protein